MLEITDENFDQEIANGVVVLDYWAEWCGPCQIAGPIFDEVSQNPDLEGVKFGKVNVDENPEITSRFHVRSIPTFAIFKNGELVEKTPGVPNKDGLSNRIWTVAN